MTFTSERLLEFFKSPAHPGVFRLRATGLADGSCLDLVGRLIGEAIEILRDKRDYGRADSLIEKAPFDIQEVGCIYGAYRQIEKARANGIFDEEAMMSARLLSDGLNGLSVYYDQKVALSYALRDSTKKILDGEIERIGELVWRDDHDALVDEFSHAACLLLDADEVPQHETNMRSLLRARMAKAIGKEIGRVSQPMHPEFHVSITAWLGKPETQRHMEQKISALSMDIDRNGSVLAAIRDMVARLKETLDPAPATPMTGRPKLRLVSSGFKHQ